MTARAEDPGSTRPARRPGRPPLLSRDRLARAAFELVDREGVEALTIGRLARELGVGSMTIYGYAASKDAIVAMLPDLLLEDVPPIDMRKSWQNALEEVFVSVYRNFLNHRHVTQAIAESPVFGPAQARIIEGALVRLERAGFSDRDAFELQRTLSTYTLGFAMFAVAEAQAGAHRPRVTWTHDLGEGEYPHVARVSELFGAEVNEHQYLAGLRRILRA
ncbi:TetR/AcrR family transcriptional regulator [Mycobacterium sp.]|uniref:TetR/AcrR family transcriptional regulator n=1 Tax=Mycobacterium sp. TaxID=1785 RepID=UPI0025F5159C|nr:TetR/AcrR family transcriptional regulator [Mycobacterium sp.]